MDHSAGRILTSNSWLKAFSVLAFKDTFIAYHRSHTAYACRSKVNYSQFHWFAKYCFDCSPYQLIFANIKHLNAKGDSVERITLEQFRDDVVLCTDIETVIQNIVKQPDSIYEIPRSVVQMLLVLG